MTLDPVEFLEKISHFIPYPRRHRRHYHGALAPSSPLRKQIATIACAMQQPRPIGIGTGAANAQKRLENAAKTKAEVVEKTKKVSQKGQTLPLWPSLRMGQGPHG